MFTRPPKALGHLTLRQQEQAGCLAGTLKIDTIPIPVVGRLWGTEVQLSGPLTSGEMRRDGNKRVGELRHGGYPYRFEGEWDEDKEGRVLKCVVMDMPA